MTQSGKKRTWVSKYLPGYIVDFNGQKLEGEIQIKVENNDTTEVGLKQGKDKQKFARMDIQYFQPRLRISDFKEDRKEKKNFYPGYVIDNDGNKKEAKIALRFKDEMMAAEGQYFEKDWLVYEILMEDKDGLVWAYKPKSFSRVAQTINGETTAYDRYRSIWTQALADGAVLMAENPFPTSVNKAMTALGNAASSAASSKLDQKMAENDWESSGPATVNSGAAYNTEYLTLNRDKGSQMEIVTKASCEEWVEALFINCPAFQALDKKQKKDYLKWKNMLEAVNYYNQTCAK